uniref:Uncharacterized protein n=1 Tax=Zosterops lateralis melanops TaxID=1220523 RepID=A0A8D2PZE4_ZOSLA
MLGGCDVPVAGEGWAGRPQGPVCCWWSGVTVVRCSSAHSCPSLAVTSVGQPSLAVTSVGQPSLAVTSVGQPSLAVTSVGQPSLAVTSVGQPSLAVTSVQTRVVLMFPPLLGEAVTCQQCLRCTKLLCQREELTAHLQ